MSLNFLFIEASTFSKPIRIIFNVINTIIVLILIFILVIKIEIRIDIRNNIVEIGFGILSILSILNNDLYSLAIMNSIIIVDIISVNISIAEILFSINIGK